MADRDTPTPLTSLLREWKQGDEAGAGEILALMYPELRGIAARFLRDERPGHTLQPTALVNELYIRLTTGALPECRSRAHFLALSTQIIRRILVDHARSRCAERHGGKRDRVPLDEAQLSAGCSYEQLLDVNEALEELKQADARAASVVEMRFFLGLEEKEIAGILDVSEITVKRDWKFARSWLLARLGGPTTAAQ